MLSRLFSSITGTVGSKDREVRPLCVAFGLKMILYAPALGYFRN
jgi:hypothetical protein